MRHRNAHRKLGRRSGARRALLRSLVRSLFLAEPTEEHAERIQTTPEKAKAARGLAEKLITLGKRNTLAARRRALELLPDKPAVRKLFDEIAPRYEDRNGGYTRILRLARGRVGDAADQVIFELVGRLEAAPAAPRPVVKDEEPEPGPAEPKTPEENAEEEAEEEAEQDTEEDEKDTGATDGEETP
jgi:large subunit ribosomal protein L17